MGRLRAGVKSDLVGSLEALIPSQQNVPNPSVQVTVLDGTAIVNMIQAGAAKTFMEYAESVFSPHILSQLQNVERLDTVWYQYLTDSLKAEARSKRGKGIRRRVEPSSIISGSWQAFLRIDGNKTELFSLLANGVTALDSDKPILNKHDTVVLCNQARDNTDIAPCTHEEADTRILLHLADAVKEGYPKVSIRTVDTDVLVLAVKAAQCFNLTELWMTLGLGRIFGTLQLMR